MIRAQFVFILTTLTKLLPSTESIASNRTIRYYVPSGSIYGKRAEIGPELFEENSDNYDNQFSGYHDPSNEMEFKKDIDAMYDFYPYSEKLFGKLSNDKMAKEPIYDIIIPLKENSPGSEREDNLRNNVYPFSEHNYEKPSRYYPISGSSYGKRQGTHYPVSGSPFGKRQRTHYPISGSPFGKRQRTHYPISGSPYGKRKNTHNPSDIFSDNGDLFFHDILPKQNLISQDASVQQTQSKKNYYPISGSPYGKRSGIDLFPDALDNFLNEENYKLIEGKEEPVEIKIVLSESEPSKTQLSETLMLQ